ncbi:hypothetical protein FRUB_02623 [Fimbriiglobus ruber]|uniref:Uncharacterized protein n=2 Tax=Fimbriiglobus ruber TaxID=1908690 RepID=A0A225DTU3_9BACT|nr:hypothetical protein FRUB_02623 [Fimbriiglobus ruber]
MQPTGGERQTGGTDEAVPPGRMVRNGVIAALGRPPEFYDITVRAVWENHYRVNVLVGPDPTSIRIAHSYFVKAGENGDILSATPRICRLYA